MGLGLGLVLAPWVWLNAQNYCRWITHTWIGNQMQQLEDCIGVNKSTLEDQNECRHNALGGWSASCCHASPTICPTRPGAADERTQRLIITRALTLQRQWSELVLRIQFVSGRAGTSWRPCFFWSKRFWPACWNLGKCRWNSRALN